MAMKSMFFGLNKAVDESESVISLVLSLVISRFLVASIDIAMVADKILTLWSDVVVERFIYFPVVVRCVFVAVVLAFVVEAISSVVVVVVLVVNVVDFPIKDDNAFNSQ